MTHKKLSWKIAKRLRKFFGFSFVESQRIARAIVVDYCDPEDYLNRDEASLMDTLYHLSLMNYDSSWVYAITGTIRYEWIGSKWNKYDDEKLIHYQLTNLHTGTIETYTDWG